MKYFIILFYSFSSFSLVISDQMSAKVLKAYAKNYLVINRGIEDGIFKGEHIKLTNKNGFIARAICVKPRMLISHCKVYRVVRPQLLSLDADYKLSSIKQSEMPSDLKHLRVKKFKNQFNDFTDVDVEKALPVQDKRIAEYDLINDFDPNKYPLREVPPTLAEAVIEKNFDKEQFKKDFRRLDVNLFASPLSFQKQGSQYSHNLGLHAKNNGSKYDFAGYFQISNTKVSNQYTKNSIKKRDIRFGLDFELKDFSQRASLISYLQIRREEFDGVVTPLSSNRLGAVGFKYLVKNEDKEQISISYTPTFESTSFNSTLKSQKVSDTFLRHHMSLKYENIRDKRIQYSGSLDFLPSLKFEETILMANVKLGAKITEDFSVQYMMEYYSNSLISKNYDIDDSDLRNTFLLNYKLNL